jgi:hypothetical protein
VSAGAAVAAGAADALHRRGISSRDRERGERRADRRGEAVRPARPPPPRSR